MPMPTLFPLRMCNGLECPREVHAVDAGAASDVAEGVAEGKP